MAKIGGGIWRIWRRIWRIWRRYEDERGRAGTGGDRPGLLTDFGPI
jgi:hypothetical protein